MFGQKEIVEKFMSNVALVDSLLGREKGKVIYRNDIEYKKMLLSEVYGYKDIYKLIPEKVDEDKFNKILNTIFTYHDHPERKTE